MHEKISDHDDLSESSFDNKNNKKSNNNENDLLKKEKKSICGSKVNKESVSYIEKSKVNTKSRIHSTIAESKYSNTPKEIIRINNNMKCSSKKSITGLHNRSNSPSNSNVFERLSKMPSRRASPAEKSTEASKHSEVIKQKFDLNAFMKRQSIKEFYEKQKFYCKELHVKEFSAKINIKPRQPIKNFGTRNKMQSKKINEMCGDK